LRADAQSVAFKKDHDAGAQFMEYRARPRTSNVRVSRGRCSSSTSESVCLPGCGLQSRKPFQT